MSIPVIVVDDVDTDRFIASRRLSRSDGFGDVVECQSGEAFLRDHFAKAEDPARGDDPCLVLMDINMPGRNGFEIVDEIQSMARKRRVDPKIIVMMVSSSDNPFDRDRASEKELVKGYVVKPLDTDDVDEMRAVYNAEWPT